MTNNKITYSLDALYACVLAFDCDIDAIEKNNFQFSTMTRRIHTYELYCFSKSHSHPWN